MTPDEEAHHLARVESELRREFPQLSAHAVRGAIQLELRVFDDAQIRDYVPLLVTRRVRNWLRQQVID